MHRSAVKIIIPSAYIPVHQMAEEPKTSSTQVTNVEIRESFESLNSILAAYSKNLSDIDDAEAKKASTKLSAIGKDFIEGEVSRSVHSVIDTFTSMVDKVASKDYSSSDTKKKMDSLLFLPSSVEAIAGVVDELVKGTDELNSHLESTGIMKVDKYRNTLDGSVVTKEDYGKMSEEDRGKYVAVTGYDNSSISSIDSAVNYITSIAKSVSKVEKVSRRDIRRNSKTVKTLSKTVPAMIDGLMSAVVSINSTIGSDERVKQLVGWQTTSELEYLTWTDKNGNEHFIEKKDKWGNTEKVENIRYVKPHFAAENGLFRVGEYLTKVFSSIEKLSSMDSSKLKKPRKLRRDMKRLAGEVQDTVWIITREFSKINVDRKRTKQAMSLLLGDQGTETTVERSRTTLLTSQSANGYDKESNDSSVSKMVTGKRVSVFEMINGFFDAANKIMSFDFKDFFKKSRKFKRKARRVSASVASIVESVLKMVDVSAEHSKEEFDTAISNIKKLDAVSDSMGHLIKVARKIVNNAKRAKFQEDTEERVNRLVDVLLIPIDKLGSKEAAANAKNAVKTTSLFVATIGAVVGLALLVGMSLGKNAGDVSTGTLAMGVFAAGSTSILDKLTDKQEEIKTGALTLLYIGGAFLLFTASILLLGLAKEPAAASIAGFTVLVIASLVILYAVQKITDRGIDKGSGLPNACLPLLAIAGSFIMFSLSILLLGLTNELTWQSMVGFAAIVGIAVGVLFLLSLLKKDVVRGALAMLVMGAAFMVFSGVLAIMAVVSEDMDFGSMMALVGVLTALIGVGILAGFAVVPVVLGAAAMVVLSIGLLTITASLLAVDAMARRIGDPRESLKPLFDSIAYIVNKMSDLGMLTVLEATANATLALVMMYEMLAVCAAVRLMQMIAPSKEDTDRLTLSMNGIVDSISTVTDSLADISVLTIGKAVIVAGMALAMLVLLAPTALILLGLSRLRIPTEFDKNNKPIAWESIDGASFDRIGAAMNGMVSALKTVADGITDIGVLKMTGAMVVAVEALAMMLSVSGIMGLLIRLGSGRIPVDWDKDNKPKAWETMDTKHISDASAMTKTLVSSIDEIATQIAGYNVGKLAVAATNAKKMKKITSAVSSMLDLVVRLTEGPISYGEVDDEGNLKPGTSGKISGNLGDYIHSHSKQISSNIDSLIGIFNSIANQVASEGGIGTIDKKTLRRAKKNISTVTKIVEMLDPMINLIKSLSSGEYTIKSEEEGGKEEKVNLGVYLSKNSKVVRTNLKSVISLVQGIAEDVQKAFAAKDSVSKRDLKDSSKKINRVTQIIDGLNPALDLIMRLSDGEFTITPSEEELANGAKERKVNLGQYLSEMKPVVERNVTDLIAFVGQIGAMAAELGKDSNTSNRDLKRGAKKATLVGSAIDTITSTLELINQLASGEIQVGVNEDGSPVTQNLSKFLEEKSESIKDNIQKLVQFVVGENGIQSYLDKLSGEKDKSMEKKQNSMALIQGMTDVINGIIDMTSKLGEKILDNNTAELFSTDNDKNLKGQLTRLMEGYAVPLGDKTIFANASKFKIRFKNLTDYDKLMKRIIDIKSVSNYEKSVKATGDMVTSINSIDDVKIDKLNTLMKSMIKFGETMDDALKNVLDQVVDLSKELHYIIEYNENNPRQPKPAEPTGTGIVPISTSAQTSSQTVAQNNKHEKANRGMSQMTAQKISGEVSTIEERLRKIEEYVSAISVSFADGVSKT